MKPLARKSLPELMALCELAVNNPIDFFRREGSLFDDVNHHQVSGFCACHLGHPFCL